MEHNDKEILRAYLEAWVERAIEYVDDDWNYRRCKHCWQYSYLDTHGNRIPVAHLKNCPCLDMEKALHELIEMG